MLVAGFLAASQAAQAQTASPRSAREHPALTEFEKQGGLVDHLGRYGSLEGFVLVTPDQKSIKTVYVTPEGNLVMGTLVDRDGKNYSARQLLTYKERMEGSQAAVKDDANTDQLPKSEQVYAQVESSGWVAVGEPEAPYLYMFVNANCEHCQKFFQDLLPAIEAGQIQLRLIPFGAVAANREGGAALLSAQDPKAAWLSYIKGDKTALAAAKADPSAFEKVDANTKLFADRKMQGPPFTMYRKPADGEIAILVGRPENPMLVIADLME